jgi:DNA-binding NarL/FixJ family response regulator
MYNASVEGDLGSGGQGEMGGCGVILVIDHDREFRVLAEDVLGRMGHLTRAVASAEEAQVFLDGERPALVVIEVELPELSGLAVLAQLLETFGENLPVMLTSAVRDTPLDRAAGLLLGADDYLVKPIDPAELVARVRRSLRRSSVPLASANGNGNNHVEATLSPREREILALLAEGQTQKQIATSLVISPKTVGTHIQHLLAKLGVHSRAQAVAVAYSRGLVEADVVAHELTLGHLPV